MAIALGVATALVLALVPNPFADVTRAVLVWDVGCGFFVVAVLFAMRGSDEATIRRRAASQEEGAVVILALTILASVASLVAIAAELSAASGDHGVADLFRVGLAFGTVVLSWFFVQLNFTLHYAHEFYAPTGKRGDAVRGGLAFPGGEAPDYWDFLHFALVIGVAAQTADVAFTSKSLRRIGTLHSAVAFGFNTVVLALTINLVAGLF
jgi:uncharacterized membrane protein